MATAPHDGHDHDAYAPADEWESGPAKIKTVARRYEGELARRFRRVKSLVRATVAENDALRLSDSGLGDAFAAPVRDFQFTDDASKEQAFREWFDAALEDEVIEPVGDRALRNGDHYTAMYVRSTYKSGMRHAGRQMTAAGMDVSNESLDVSFRAPLHTDQARTLYRRQLSALQGLTEATGREASRVLTEGLLAGENPRTVARDLNDRIDAYGITNARRTARTELSRSYNSAAAKRYQQHGVKMVEILVYQPCSICQELKADEPYSVEEAAGILPVHPQCVCSIIPLI